MIDLTPLDVRKKRGDFRKMLRGYDPQEVDSFLELVAERLEVLVKENMGLKDRTELLSEQVKSQEGRERAIQEALVSAQTLREEIAQQASREAEAVREHAKREAALVTQQAQGEVRQLREKADAEVAQIRQQAVGDTEHLRRKTEAELERLTLELERLIEEKTGVIDELERKRTRFLRAFRSLLEREMDVVAIEEGKAASEDAILELDLTGGQRRAQARMIETAALDLLSDDEEDAGEAEAPAAAVPAAEVRALPEPEERADESEVTPVGADHGGADVEVETAVSAEATPDGPADTADDAPTPVAAEAAPEVETGEDEEEPIPLGTGFELVTEHSGAETPSDPVTGPDTRPGGVSIPEADAGELLVDQAFTMLEEADDRAEQDDADLDSLVDKVLTDNPAEEAVVIPIDTLAPGPENRDDLDDEARAAVNQLFDREDVPIRAADGDEEGVEDAWSRVLRGDDGEGSGPRSAAEEEPRGSWSPNFPEKGRKEEISGWSGPKDESRWR